MCACGVVPKRNSVSLSQWSRKYLRREKRLIYCMDQHLRTLLRDESSVFAQQQFWHVFFTIYSLPSNVDQEQRFTERSEYHSLCTGLLYIGFNCRIRRYSFSSFVLKSRPQVILKCSKNNICSRYISVKGQKIVIQKMKLSDTNSGRAHSFSTSDSVSCSQEIEIYLGARVFFHTHVQLDQAKCIYAQNRLLSSRQTVMQGSLVQTAVESGGGAYFLIRGLWGCAAVKGLIFTTGLTIMGSHIRIGSHIF